MCAHYRIAQYQLLLDLFGIDPASVPLPPPGFGEGKPTNPVAAILRNPKSGVAEVRYPTWGLVPSWAKPDWNPTKCLNARAETLSERPAYREAYRKRRCILPVELFFETDETSIYQITMADSSLMAVAGLWEWRKLGDEPPTVTCTMITTESNDLIKPVNERMPAVLRIEDYLPWVDPAITDSSELACMLIPFDASLMRMEFSSYKKSAKKKREPVAISEEGNLFS